MSNRKLLWLVAVDAIVLGGIWYLIPVLRRPFEILMAAIAILGFATAVAARRHRVLPTVLMMIASVAFAFFILEMADKFFQVTDVLQRSREVWVGSRERGWNAADPLSYRAARERALGEGVDPALFDPDFAGDFFAAEGLVKKYEMTKKSRSWIENVASTSEAGPWVNQKPLGMELRPDTVFRHFGTTFGTGTLLYDAKVSVGPHGYRATAGDDQADDVYIFAGCSFTHGIYLSDHQTLPQQFSEALGYTKRVDNFGLGRYGPHQVLRDLELDYHTAKAGIRPERVRAVVYSYIEDHTRRVRYPFTRYAPRYELVDGKPVCVGDYSDKGGLGRLRLLEIRSRVPAWLLRGLDRNGSRDVELTFAIIGAIHNICRSRYNVPLTVVCWEDDAEAIRRFRELGVALVLVDDVFGGQWRDDPIEYLIFDGHPNANANRLLAGRLVELLAAGEGTDADAPAPERGPEALGDI